MNIGISTVHYAHNYGAMLQGYALKTYLESLGHHVVMTDRRHVSLTQWNPKSWRKESWKGKLLYPKYLWKWYLPTYCTKRKREDYFENFLSRYLNVEDYTPDSHLDAIVYGSDQIWSKFDYGFDDIWWGVQESNTSKRIAYAASMGMLDIQDNDEPYLRNALARFDAVAVREKNLQDELNNRKLFAKEVERVIDPTFLLEKDEWLKINSKRIIEEPYLLFYDFQIDEETDKIVRKISEEKHLRVIRLTDGVVHVNKEDGYMVTAGPREFVSLFRYADFVVSSSFHGTAFSIINNKPFYVRQVWNTDRVKVLLETLGISDRFIDGVDGVDLSKEIDYSTVNLRIDACRKQGQKFLKSNLGNE